MNKPTLCLNMIVKDEEDIIYDSLKKLCDKVKFDYWVICDTGSSDNTKKIIGDFFTEKKINGELHSHKWINFAVNRTLALNAAVNKSDLLLIFDADDEIEGTIQIPESRLFDSYMMNFSSINGRTYQRICLINNRIGWRYRSIIHEYIECLEKNYSETVLEGDYFIISGRNGNRNKDPDKYLKDAEILKNGYYEAKEKNDSIYLRYGFYCANSYKDHGLIEEASKWYKIVLDNDNWTQEKYISCLELFYYYYNINEKEKGIHYLIESFKYDINRYECIYFLIKYYDSIGYTNIAYKYYHFIKTDYETKYITSNNNNKLFIQSDKEQFFLPLTIISIANKMIEKEPDSVFTVVKMYELIFTKKFKKINKDDIKVLLLRLVKDIDICIKTNERFLNMFQIYVDFLGENIDIYKEEIEIECVSKFKNYDINFDSFKSLNVEKKFTKDECKNSMNILIYCSSSTPWNYSYFLKNALGGVQTSVMDLALCFPDKYNIYICGDVIEEQNDNISFILLTNLNKLINETPFHSIIICRNVDFFISYPETSFYQSYVWVHDIQIGSVSHKSIINKINDNINGYICLTEWHKTYISNSYPEIKDKITIINKGISVDKFCYSCKKKSNRFIYTSRLERALPRLLDLWSNISCILPDAELFISCYCEVDEKILKRIESDTSIIFLGSLNKSKLYELMASSEYWLYPTTSYEPSCMTSMEMLMSGVICLYYPVAGLTDTINGNGIKVEEGSEINTLLDLTNNNKIKLIKDGKDYALTCDIKNKYKMWAQLLGIN